MGILQPQGKRRISEELHKPNLDSFSRYSRHRELKLALPLRGGCVSSFAFFSLHSDHPKHMFFKTGDRVMLRLYKGYSIALTKILGRKFTQQYAGPFTVLERIGHLQGDEESLLRNDALRPGLTGYGTLGVHHYDFICLFFRRLWHTFWGRAYLTTTADNVSTVHLIFRALPWAL